MKRNICRPNGLFRNTDGAVTIEFVIVLPVLLLIIFGIIEFSILMFASATLESAVIAAAREGGTTTAINSGNQQERITTLINSRLNALFNTANVQITVTAYNDLAQTPVACGGACPSVNLRGQGSLQLYTVRYPYPLRTPIIRNIIGQEGVYNMVSTTLVKNEPGTYPMLSQ